MRHLVLFDIDGTLLSSTSAGRSAIHAAFEEEFADLAFFDHVRFDGKTDPQIVAELYAAAGEPDRATPAHVEIVLTRYLGHLERRLAAGLHEVKALPGVPPLLEALHARDDVIVGLLTGNVVPGARLKLEAAGLPFDRFTLGAFGSDSAHRPDLPAVAALRAESLMGRVPSGRDVVIVGDTPADITCGLGICAHAIGVATGSYRLEELQEAGAAAAFPNLADTAAVMEAILCSNSN
jgi:phosphoglycolate phosphatase